MKKPSTLKILFFTILIVISYLSLTKTISFSLSSNRIYEIQLDNDTINPVTAEYIIKSIDKAYLDNVKCLIIKMDTPGGLLDSTRDIVKKMLTSKIPIVVYIAPSGSRAGSAGVFITYASHIAAMAPSTNIGAAHPVQMGEQSPKRSKDWEELRDLIKEIKKNTQINKESADESKKEKANKKGSEKNNEAKEPNSDLEQEITPDENPMRSKILQDTVAFIKSIAKERNRNVDWAIKSVTKSSSITSEEALEKGVIEIIAKSDDDLLAQLNGRKVNIDGEEIELKVKDALIEKIDMDARQHFFNILANPNIAYFLMILGFYGLLFEVTHPGFGVPGILGIVFLILAFYSMHTLPTNYAGLALIILGLVLLIAEAYVPGFGVLTLGGIICMVLGSMLLFESVDPIMRVSKSAIIAFTVSSVAITIFLITSVIKSFKAKVIGGQEGLVGTEGEAQTDILPNKKGKVYIHGELWNATSKNKIKKGEIIIVKAVKGLLLKVDKLDNKEE